MHPVRGMEDSDSERTTLPYILPRAIGKTSTSVGEHVYLTVCCGAKLYSDQRRRLCFEPICKRYRLYKQYPMWKIERHDPAPAFLNSGSLRPSELLIQLVRLRFHSSCFANDSPPSNLYTQSGASARLRRPSPTRISRTFRRPTTPNYCMW